jgi:hypothetical protein
MGQDLHKLLPPRSAHNTRFVVYFDECHTLAQVIFQEIRPRSQVPRSALDVLFSLINDLRSAGGFGIFLSTQSQLSHYVRPETVHPSDREADREYPERLAPYVELPFDQWKGGHAKIFDEGQTTLQEVCSAEYVSRFGRPLCVSVSVRLRLLMMTGLQMVDSAKIFERPFTARLCDP